MSKQNKKQIKEEIIIKSEEKEESEESEENITCNKCNEVKEIEYFASISKTCNDCKKLLRKENKNKVDKEKCLNFFNDYIKKENTTFCINDKIKLGKILLKIFTNVDI